ncbi:putative ethanolamine utilization protein [Clostridium aceticum]|uniref:Putative ethanolamine utilization protein n=1 Tax=Clostridium aceticum TaxID=84022 RepID=A0A0D8IF19_9CLOT|nr:hypothetical protein [Clostridium aceticum]AKL93922.1 putative ethanolamine utilization protein [Clostridium aceticum]KJF28689.1 hypothetical protein TZ02_01960 [Clostridium aceticum]
MEMEALVQKITEEVLKQLREGQRERQTSEELQFTKKAWVLFSKEQVNQQYITYLEEMGIACVFLEECTEDEIKQMDYIILPILPLSSLAHIAMGVEGDEISKKVIRSLLHGKEVFVLSDGMEHRSFEKSSQPYFYQMYIDYEKKLQDFGVKIGTLEEILSPSQQQPQQPISPIMQEKTTEETSIDNKVITEKILKEMDCHPNSRLCIRQKAIITPMAKDYIRMKKIQVIRV